MLEQKTEIIEFMEYSINDDEPIYLITWAPDPKELPDADFYIQHNFNVNILSDFLKTCQVGLFCVESTQQGYPHYHGWYQIASQYEVSRISIMKTLRRFGIVKITEVEHSYKVFNWKEKSNALYYYKKDLLDSMFTIDPNPITKDTVSTVNWDVLDSVGFFSNQKVDRTIQDKISQRQFYRNFYSNTIEYLKS